jgi:hypothetical protein
MSTKIIYCLGDSHISFFSGNNNIVPMWEEKNNNVNEYENIKCFKVLRLGAFTAYNLYKNKESKEKISNALSIIEKNSYILLSFGEIDCRCHIVKQSEMQKKSIEYIADECVCRYIESVDAIKKLGYNIILWNVIPPYSVSNKCGKFTEYGTISQRKDAAIYFNKYIEKSIDSDIFFLNIYNEISDVDGYALPNIFFDDIHLSQYGMPFAIEKLIKYNILEG